MAKQTPLYDLHVQEGAQLIDFAGFSMPVTYGSIIEEHGAVREAAGLFDISHMGEIEVTGKDSEGFLQYVTPNEVSQLQINQAQYTALLTPSGTIVDDLILYQLGKNHYLLCVNAATTEKDYHWILSKSEAYEVTIQNRSDAYAQMALQGPKSASILQHFVPFDLQSLKPFTCRRLLLEGWESILSRTGYTGEDGFEIYIEPEGAEEFWKLLADRGRWKGMRSAGLGARDTLRLEAGFPLYGHDIDDKTSALEAGLGWIVKFDKADFIGKRSLLKQKKKGIARKRIGFILRDPGVARAGYPMFVNGRKAGHVTSGSYSPTLKRSIGMGYLPVDVAEEGALFEIKVRNRRVRAEVTLLPFYKRDVSNEISD